MCAKLGMAKEQIPSIYIDTSVYLWYFGEAVQMGNLSVEVALERQIITRRILEKAENKELITYTSTFTKVECAFIKEEKEKGNPQEDALEILDAVFNDEKITKLVNMSDSIASKARQIFRATKFDTNRPKIKPKDAVHVATAIIYGVDKLYTYDEGMCKWSGAEEIDNLIICHPDIADIPIL